LLTVTSCASVTIAGDATIAFRPTPLLQLINKNHIMDVFINHARQNFKAKYQQVSESEELRKGCKHKMINNHKKLGTI
jgi:hypothetical protein